MKMLRTLEISKVKVHWHRSHVLVFNISSVMPYLLGSVIAMYFFTLRYLFGQLLVGGFSTLRFEQLLANWNISMIGSGNPNWLTWFQYSVQKTNMATWENQPVRNL